MAARARKPTESYSQYRKNLKKEDELLKLRLRLGPKRFSAFMHYRLFS